MIKFLIDILFPASRFANLMGYISVRSALVAVTALVLSLCGGALFLRRARWGEEIRDDGPQTHLKKGGTPSMGGVFWIISASVSTLLFQDLANPYTYFLLLILILFGAVGFVDDWAKNIAKKGDGLSVRQKFFWQIAISALIMVFLCLTRDKGVTLFYVPFVKEPVADFGWWYVPYGVFWMVGFSNAVNLTDGLDGLATSLSLIVITTLTIMLYLAGHILFSAYLHIPYIPYIGEATIFCAALLGALLGFLWFNCYPAQVMMGDTGSLPLGSVIAVIALLLHAEIILLLLGGVFVAEAGSTMLQVGSYKMRHGKRIFLMAPLHHHFEMKGWRETKVVARFIIVGLALAALTLLSYKVR